MNADDFLNVIERYHPNKEETKDIINEILYDIKTGKLDEATGYAFCSVCYIYLTSLFGNRKIISLEKYLQ